MSGAMTGVGASAASVAMSGVTSQVVGAMAGNIASQGVNMLAGQQDKFDWKGVAAAGVSSAASFAASRVANMSNLSPGAQMGAQMLIRGTSQGVINKINGDSFGKGFAAGAVS